MATATDGYHEGKIMADTGAAGKDTADQGKACTADDRRAVSQETAAALVAAQFPQWAALPVRPVDVNGWDNCTFRLGDAMKIRMPTAIRYAAQGEKEARWLPHIAAHLPQSVAHELPVPVAIGRPGGDYPFPWVIQSFIPGESAAASPAVDRIALAADLADWLLALHRVPVADAPPAGPHNFFRGGDLSVYDSETQACLTRAAGRYDRASAAALWQAALSSRWQTAPVFVHGDISTGNLLLRDEKLVAVIDFGCMGVGDPACDLMMTWTFFAGESRALFRSRLGLDAATFARARGWALWKALLALDKPDRPDGTAHQAALLVIETLLAEHRAAEHGAPL